MAHHPPRETVFETDTHTLPPTSSTLTTFVVLVGLAIASLVVGFSDLGPYKLLGNLLVAGTQAAVLGLFFMDLRQADKLTWLCVGASMFWSGLLFLFTITDYLTRHFAAY